MTLPKTYDPAAAEAARYADWEASGAFSADPAKNAYPYVIMMPPPNVTGSLHMGHGLTFTLQDILIRYARMQGKDTLWQPGTDHAGIATQMVVERMLEGDRRSESAAAAGADAGRGQAPQPRHHRRSVELSRCFPPVRSCSCTMRLGHQEARKTFASRQSDSSYCQE